MLNRALWSILLIVVLISENAVAQERFFQRNQHGFALTLGWIDHTYTGSVDVIESLDFQGVGFGLSYMGPQLRARGLYARGNGAFFDFSGNAWILPSSLKIQRQTTTLALPIGVLVAGRRVSSKNNPAPFNAQAIFLGAGGSFQHDFNQRSRFEVQIMPFIGMTGSRDADAVGLSWAADAEALLTTGNVFPNVGIIIGYTFRYQTWNVNGSRAFTELADEINDYAGTVHTFFAGIEL